MSACQVRSARARVGDERWLLEKIDHAAVEALARKSGWKGGDEGLREFCEPEDAAEHTVHASLEAAVAAAKEWLAKGTSFYGCAIIDHQIFQQPHDDRGRLVRVPPCWELQEAYEVAMDGEAIRVDR